MIKRIILGVVIFVAGPTAFAQEMYMSVSGQNVSIQSGDDRHQYDIWIKPAAGAQNGSLQIFDAGLGGAVDLISGDDANTSTSYSLYRFEEIYSLAGNTMRNAPGAPAAITQLIARNEERFKNRWVPLSELSASENGYIIRVSTGEGDDVNSFNFRVANAAGQILSGSEWKVIAIDLSVGVYRSSAETRFQLRPYLPGDRSVSPQLRVSGEEDSEVSKIDAFGQSYSVTSTNIPSSRFGLANSWGIEIGGSEDWLNTLTITGMESPVLWEFEPIALNELNEPEITINTIEASQCTEKQFELSGNALTPADLSNARWITNDEVISNGGTPVISFDKRGQIPVDILIPNERSYFPQYWIYNTSVFVNTPPVARLSVPKRVLSPSEVLSLSAQESYDQEGRQIYYAWFVNGIRRGNGPTFEFSNTVSGSYTISVEVSDGGSSVNCSSARQEAQIRVNTQPYAEIQAPPVAGTGDEVMLSVVNQTDSDNDSLKYLWEGIGIPPNSSGRAVTVSHQQPGVYPVRLTVNDGSGAQNATYSVNKVYEINAAPIPDFSIPEMVAPGDIFSLNAVEASDPNQDELTYRWLLNGDEVARGEISTLSLEEPGNYEVSLAVDDQRGVSNSVQRLTREIYVNAPPRPVITAVPVTSSASVEFAASQSMDPESELRFYTWDFGDGTQATGPNVSHTYQSTGSYTVTLTVDDGANLKNSVQSSKHVIVVNSFPIAQFGAPEVVAPGQSFTVDASQSSDVDGRVTSYAWMVNGDDAGNGMQNTITLESTGIHTIALSVQDDSGFEEAQGFTSRQVRVNQPPVAVWRTEPTDPVPGSEIKFLATDSYDTDGSVEQYLWRFDDGTEIKGSQVQRIFQDGGLKEFTLTVTDNDGLGNSSSTIEGSVRVNHQPYIVTESVVRTNSLSVRLDASESYDLDDDALNFEWTLPDGTKRNEASFTWFAPEPGIHIVGLTVTDGQGLSNSSLTETVRVQVNRPVQAVVDSVITSCTGQTVLFNSSQSYDPDGDAFRVNWEFGNGDSSDEANPTYMYEKPGIYEAKVTLSDGFSGKSSLAKIPVIIEGSPVAKLNISDRTVCVNTPVRLDGSESTDPSGSLPALSWDLGDGNSATGPTYTHVFTEPGEYTITLTAEGSGSGQCSNVSQTTTTVTVVEGPVARFEVPDWTAPGEPIILDGSASESTEGIKKATWLIDGVEYEQELHGLTTTHTFDQPGEYQLTLLVETNSTTDCNTVSLTKTIRVNAPPVINWTLPEFAVAGNDLTLDAFASRDPDGFIKQFKWYIDDGFVSYNASEIVKAVNPGRHKVTLEVTDNSNASNNKVVREKYFFANSSPTPVIIGPKTVYQNQEITLRSGMGQDRDGDLLSTRWKLDSEPLPNPQFTASETRPYTVTLIQDDGRGLPNSADSTLLVIKPVPVAEISPVYPSRIVMGGVLSIDALNLSDQWTFVNQNFYESTWRATSTGDVSFELAWTPDGKELARRNFPVTVVEPLRFTEQATPVIIPWNPVNPTAQIKAPAINRPAADVQIVWKQGGEVVGRGLQISPELIPGQNRFAIEVTDLKVAQSRPVTVDLIVTTQ